MAHRERHQGSKTFLRKRGLDLPVGRELSEEGGRENRRGFKERACRTLSRGGRREEKGAEREIDQARPRQGS